MAADGAAHRLAAVVLIVGVALRWVQLGADPHYHHWIGYITDEGRWTAHARSLALFGDLVGVEWTLHLLLAPLFQGAAWLAFQIGGVSLPVARTVTAAAGTALLLLFWFGLRRSIAPGAVLVALVWLAFDSDVLVLSRVAIPEIPALVLALAAYLVLFSGGTETWRLPAAGLLLGLGFALKATTAGILVPFMALVLVRFWRTPLGPVRGLAAFLAGLLVPALGLAALALATGALPATFNLENARALISNLYIVHAYGLLRRLLHRESTPPLALYGLVVWAGAMGWITRDKGASRSAEMHFVASSLWLAWALLQIILLGYQPPRYAVQAVAPAAITLAAGLSMLRPARIGEGGAAHRVFCLLPVAFLVVPLFSGSLAWLRPESLRWHLTIVVLSLVLLVPLSRRLRAEWLGHVTLVAAIGATLAVTLVHSHPSLGYWGGPDPAHHLAFWSGLLAGSTLLAILVRRKLDLAEDWLRTLRCTAWATATLLFLIIVPAFASPRYTLVEAGPRLEQSLPADTIAAAAASETLFLNSGLRHRTVLFARWPRHWEPDALVIAGPFADPDGRLAEEYRLVDSFRIFTRSRGRTGADELESPTRQRGAIRVYVRAPADTQPQAISPPPAPDR